jgi:hypothetical protein
MAIDKQLKQLNLYDERRLKMAGDVKVGGNVTQIQGQTNVGTQDPDAVISQAKGLETSFNFGADVDVAAAVSAATQLQSNAATAFGVGGGAGGDTEVINSGNTGPIVT